MDLSEPPEIVAPLRETEQRSACAQVGVADLRHLDHPDGMLEHGLALRRDIARVIRQVRPNLVLTSAEHDPAGIHLARHGGRRSGETLLAQVKRDRS
ncbi:PIG-L deacetylase family protein [Parenemella sanctibonifatiensis]|uniref:PIG-L deacetylase family protein n=1 Tax=Parenemella sanctibonifatiensis TaxID=2016505 RepID=UPI002B4BBA56|nr:PIG-L family deacetylase [Parenemella sanctibonifatiensis]